MYVVFACKQGKGRKTESKGIRPHQQTFKVNCPAIMRLVSMILYRKYCLLFRLWVHWNEIQFAHNEYIVLFQNQQNEKLVCTRVNLTHENHVCSEAVTKIYPEKGRVPMDETISALSLLSAHTALHQPQGKTLSALLAIFSYLFSFSSLSGHLLGLYFLAAIVAHIQICQVLFHIANKFY